MEIPAATLSASDTTTHLLRGRSLTRQHTPWWRKALFVISLPAVVVVFLGDILAAPFVSRRHDSTFHWLFFMVARSLVPVIIIGACAGYLLRHLR